MSKCVEEVKHAKIKIEENGRKVIFLNPNRDSYEKGKIDDCLVKEGIRADYYLRKSNKSVLIELKGCDIKHAFDQLFSAAEHENVKGRLGKEISFVVICSRVPRMGNAFQLAQNKAKRKYGSKVSIHCHSRELKFDDC